MQFDWKKPTVQMLGRWQPWHDGHTELFKKALDNTGQVCIMVRDVHGIEDNPFDFNQIVVNIRNSLEEHGFKMNEDYVVMKLPNIVDISYGRGVGYTITQHDLGEEVHKISATNIRADMRERGEIVYSDMKHEDWPEG